MLILIAKGQPLLQVSESGSSEGANQDPEVKAEELHQNIRKAEVSWPGNTFLMAPIFLSD